jgi:aminoglycoside phosphotransferase (APT) family kinase protein
MSEKKSTVDLVPIDRLARWLDEQGLGNGSSIRDLVALAGGSQNAVFRFTRGDRDFVLRRPRQDARVTASAAIRREAELLRALSETDVPHPRLVAACADEELLGACFYLMEPIDGWSPGSPLIEPFASSPALQREMGFAFVDAAAALGSVDYVAAGLEGFGKPEGFLERQVGRWRSQLDGYRKIEGYDGRELPHLDRVSRWLEAERPDDYRPGIIHGDLQLPNSMFAHDRPEILALIDWEMATIGDPLLDLGWILTNWSDPGGDLLPTTYIRPWVGFPSRREMIDRYLAQVDRNPSDVKYFCVLACYKLGIVLEGNVARAAAGLGDPEVAKFMEGLVTGLFDEALDLIEGNLEA